MVNLDGDRCDIFVLKAVLTSYSYWYTKGKSRNVVGMPEGCHRNSEVVCVKFKLFASLSCLVFEEYHTWIFALVIQRAKPTRRVTFPSVTCPALTYVSTLSHKRHDSRGSGLGWGWGIYIEHKICVLFFCTTFVWKISCSKKNSVKYYHKCT